MGEGEASVSGLQRRFKIGYARAGRIMDAMEQRGVVGPHLGPKPRDVIINPAAMRAHLSGGEYTHPSEIEEEMAYADDIADQYVDDGPADLDDHSNLQEHQELVGAEEPVGEADVEPEVEEEEPAAETA